MKIVFDGVEREETPEEAADREAFQASATGDDTSPTVLFPADLWRRATDAEAEQIYDAMNAQTVRLRELFRTAQTYRSDDPLWPLLEGAAKQLFGAGRSAELLAPST